ncbi:hypothetical protein BGX24_007610, partial [Mortierella sp. AD032]
VNREVWPDMNDISWTSMKLLASEIGGDPYAEISYHANRAATTEAFAAAGITCSNVTHAGHHSGAKEAGRLDIKEEDIRDGGRWIQGTGKMQQFYLQKVPTKFALQIAGFRTKPFHLRRNEVAPSLDLQRLIFPFIESLIGKPDSQENENWRKECDDEMNEVDPHNHEGLEGVLPPVYVKPSKSNPAKAPIYRKHSNIKFVLRFLLRLRRVILQDAAAYLYLKSIYHYESPLLERLPNVFGSKAFEDFQKDIA